MDPDDAVLLTDVFPTGYQAAEMGGIQPGDTVVIFGAGPVGIMAAKSSWLFGAGRVIVIDEVNYRLEFVRDYAQCEAFNFREMDDPVVFIKKLIDWIGADVCIDAVGAEARGNVLQTITGRKTLLQAGLATVLGHQLGQERRYGVGCGRIRANGQPRTHRQRSEKGITIRANQTAVKRHLPKLIDHIQSGRVSPQAIITHRVPLEEIADAYHIFSEKLDNCIKTVLIPPSARV